MNWNGDLKIGDTAGYKLRRDFEMEVFKMAEENKLMTKESITALYLSAENKTYEEGCELLLKWYRDTVNKNN